MRIERQSSVPSPVADFLVVSVLKNPIQKIVVFNDHRHPKNAKLTTSGEFLVVSVSKNTILTTNLVVNFVFLRVSVVMRNEHFLVF